MDILSKDIVRPVSNYEQNLQRYGIVISRNRLKGKIKISALKKALEIMIQRHVFLNCTFYKQNDIVYFKKQENTPIHLVIISNITNNEEKNNLYRKELNNILNPYEGLWRILLILDCQAEEMNENSNFELILSVHHSICDANSLFNLVKEILEQIQAIELHKVLYENRQLPVTQPAEKFFSDYIKEIKNGNKAAIAESNNLYKLKIDFSIPDDQCLINYLEDSFSKEETSALISKSREKGTTVHGFFAANLIKAITDIAGIDLQKKVDFLIHNSVNPRKRISNSPESNFLFCYVFAADIIVSLDNNTTIIQLAKQIISKLNENIAASEGIKYIVKRSSDNLIVSKNNMEKKQRILLITNVGRLDIPMEYGNFILYNTNFIASEKLPSIGAAITTFNNSLSYVFLYTEPWLKTSFINAINKQFKEYIRAFINNT